MFSGGCQCGQVKYEIACDELVAYACHCNECQKQTASAFALSVPVKLDELHITGELKSYERSAHSGAITKCLFCPGCGTRIYHQSSGSRSLVTLKGGTLDDGSELIPKAHLWTARKHNWVSLPAGAEIYDRQPTDLKVWRNKLLGDLSHYR